jgi:hypothetical protein
MVAGACNGTIAHVVPFLTDRGVSPGSRHQRAYYRWNRFNRGPTARRLSSRSHFRAAGIVLVGLGLGAEVDLIAFLLSRYLGMRSFGETYGYLFAIFMLGSGLGPFIIGVSFDRRGSYSLILECFGFALVLASILVLRLGPYAYPVSHRGDTNAALRAAVETGWPTATDQNVETTSD